jgi:hypothetical protein
VDYETETNARLRRLEDDAELAKVVLRYASGIDTRKFERVWECFAPGAEVVGTMFSGVVEEYLPRLLERVSSYGSTMHFMGNQLREIDGDSARTETYAVAHHFTDQAGRHEAAVVGVLYSDELARQSGGGWAITRRQVSSFWHREP